MHSKSHSSNAFARRGKGMLQSTSSARSLKKKKLPSGISKKCCNQESPGVVSLLFFLFNANVQRLLLPQETVAWIRIILLKRVSWQRFSYTSLTQLVTNNEF